MIIKQIGKIKGDQDGAIWNNYLFRFNSVGDCFIYDLNSFNGGDTEEAPEIAKFSLDRVDELRPHSNAVVFGKEYYSTDDEFPLLYTNIYNNYSWTDTPMKGVCAVYRITRKDKEFTSQLVQIIEIGFVEDCNYWKSPDVDDVRPYGNFVIDRENGKYYGFTMRDKSNSTRFFSFDLPRLSDGNPDEKYGINRVVLNVCDIKEYFDSEYQHFMQGACFNDGKIYSSEGFTDNVDNPAAIRVIDVKNKKQIGFVDLYNMGYTVEAEMIDFWDGICYYSDNHGNLYTIEFDNEVIICD